MGVLTAASRVAVLKQSEFVEILTTAEDKLTSLFQVIIQGFTIKKPVAMLRNKKYLLILITSCWGRREGKRKVEKGKGRGK